MSSKRFADVRSGSDVPSTIADIGSNRDEAAMSTFEFVFAMVSVTTSLALVHIVTGVVALIRHHDRHGFSGLHAVWMAIAFILVVSNWASFWPLRHSDQWSSLSVFMALIAMILLYAFTALVVPEVRNTDSIDLSTFHEREGRRYISAHALFAAMTLPWAFAYYGVSLTALSDCIPGIIALLLSLVALAFFRSTPAQWVVAILLLINTATMMWPTIAISD
jgi:hypothetical protein